MKNESEIRIETLESIRSLLRLAASLEEFDRTICVLILLEKCGLDENGRKK